MKHRNFGRLTLLVASLVIASTAHAQVAAYNSEAAFVSVLQPGYFLNDFTGYSYSYLGGSQSYSSGGYSYTATATPNSGLYALSVGGGSLSTLDATSALIFTFTGNPVTAVGGTFFGTDDPGALASGTVHVALASGSYVDLNAAGFAGYTSSTPISWLSVSTPASPGVFPTADHLYVGAVPEPETYAMLLSGLGLMGFIARRCVVKFRNCTEPRSGGVSFVRPAWAHEIIRLIRAYLNAGIMDGGVVSERHMGTPQGGPLSPLLANVLLDEVDKMLEARGYSFARYADDCNVYVGSMKAGERVMALLRKLYEGLKLQINEAKSAVASALERKFLGYALWVAKDGQVKCKVAKKPLDNIKARIRQLTRRSGGRSMEQVVEKLRPYVLGWKAYFGMAQTPKVWRELDEWLRHRLRAIQLKHWKRPNAIYCELKALGAKENVALQVAGNSRRWWRNSAGLLNCVLTIAYFDQMGLPRLS
jgi:hypothetical protein